MPSPPTSPSLLLDDEGAARGGAAANHGDGLAAARPRVRWSLDQQLQLDDDDGPPPPPPSGAAARPETRRPADARWAALLIRLEVKRI